jgi:hypothetical protein
VLTPFSKPPSYLQPLDPAPKDHPEGQKAKGLYDGIVADLKDAYETGDMENADRIARARTTMFTLDEVADKLAAQGLGIRFFEPPQ